MASVLVPFAAHAFESELFSVRLGSDFAGVKSAMVKKYGKPVQSGSGHAATKFDAFLISKTDPVFLIISADVSEPRFISAVQLQGTDDIGELGLPGNIKLGMTEQALSLLWPKPSSVRPVDDGYVQHDLRGTNLSVQTINGVVGSVRISTDNGIVKVLNTKKNQMHVLSDAMTSALSKYSVGNKAEQLNTIAVDRLKSLCKYRHQLRKIDSVYVIDLMVAGTHNMKDGGIKNFKPATFILDTGWAITAISSSLCKSIGCVMSDNKSGSFVKKKGTGGMLLVGPNAVKVPDFDIIDGDLLTLVGADGILGMDFILSQPLVINLPREYLCYPSKTVEVIASQLGMKSVATDYNEHMTTKIELNGKTVEGLFLDTGSSHTSLLEADVKALQLGALPGRIETNNVYGKQSLKTFGPVKALLSGLPEQMAVNIPAVTQTEIKHLRKVGTDWLDAFILGLDRSTGKLFIGTL